MANPYQAEMDILRAARMSVAGLALSPEDREALAIIIASREASQHAAVTVVDIPAHADIPLTFAEWAAEYQLDSHFDRFLAAAVYLRETDGKDVITHIDIMELYDQARWAIPANPADAIGKAANRQWFTHVKGQEDDGRKHWRLTRTGLTHFQSLKKEKIDAQ